MSPVNVNSIGAYLREQGEQARASVKHLAQAAGMANPNLTQQIAKGLRISADALYVQAGILDEHEGSTSVTEAIMADQEITDRQKQMLIDIYESFRKEVRVEAAARAAASSAPGDPPEPVDPPDLLDPPDLPGHASGQASGAAGDGDAGVAVAGESLDDPVADIVEAAEAEPPAPPGSR